MVEQGEPTEGDEMGIIKMQTYTCLQVDIMYRMLEDGATDEQIRKYLNNPSVRRMLDRKAETLRGTLDFNTKKHGTHRLNEIFSPKDES